MTKKQNRVRGFGRRSLSVVLAVLILLSTMVVMLTSTMLSASAAISYWNVAGDFNGWGDSLNNSTYRINGSSGSVTINISSDTYSSIKFKMCAYEDGWKWCGNSSGGASPGEETELSWNSGNDIQLNLPSGTTQVTFKIEVKNGKNYLTSTPNGSGGGGEGPDSSQMTFDAPVNTSNSANTADNLFWANATYFDYESDKELTDGWLKPLQAGTHNFNGAQDEWYPFYIFNREVVKAQADAQSSWSQPLYFGNFCDTNNAYDSPHHQNGYDSYGYREATNSYNVTRFVHIANNSDYNQAGSAHLANMNCSYQGLVNSQLSSTGDLLLPNGQQAPYFNSDESGPLKGYAKVVNSSFPFKVTDVADKNYKKYTFNSKGATDNVYFTWATNGSLTYPTGVNYGAGTSYGVLDGVSRFMNNGTSGYGIFPFNNASNNYKGTKTNANENLNYGFGIKTEMKFRVPAPDESNGVNTSSDPIYFSFSGDDDLWMYITDEDGNSQLVLDMGGDHKESTGYVNFNTLQAKVDKVGTGGGSVTKNFTFDYSKTYTMTVFYMERGLIESNCEMEFTMYPAGNQVNVEKEVNTANLNRTTNSTQLQDEVESIDSFNFTAYQADSSSGTNTAMKGTEYMDNAYGNRKTNASSGVFPLVNNEEASFLSQYTTNKYVQITETNPNTSSYLSYSTTWTVSDPLDSSRNTEGSGLSAAKLQLKNPSGEDYDYAQLDYKFINTPQTGSVSVTKNMNSSSSTDLSKEFNAKVEISLMGANGTFRAYPLTYTASDKSGTFETNSSGQLSSSALLKHGRTLTFSNLPTNAVVKVTEQLSSTESAAYTPSYPNGSSVTVPNGSTASITVKNTPIAPDAISGSVEGTKLLDGKPYTGDMFQFILEGVPRFSGDASNIIDTSDTEISTTDVTNSKFTFDNLSFDAPGVYRYHVYEDTSYCPTTTTDNSFDTDFGHADTDFLVAITVSKGTDNKLRIDSTVYYSYSRYDDTTQAVEHTMSSADFDPSKQVTSIVINNYLNTGSITVEKKNQKNDAVSGVTFGVYRVDEDIQMILDNNRFTEAQKYDSIMALMDPNLEAGTDTTGSNGKAVITNLSIYQDGFVNMTTSGGSNGITVDSADFNGYQKYILLEVSGPDTYSINKTINVFTFPINGQYDFTFSEDRAYVNGAIKNPDASGPGMMILKIVGIAIILFSVAMLVWNIKRNKQKAYQCAHARHMRKK